MTLNVLATSRGKLCSKQGSRVSSMIKLGICSLGTGKLTISKRPLCANELWFKWVGIWAVAPGPSRTACCLAILMRSKQSWGTVRPTMDSTSGVSHSEDGAHAWEVPKGWKSSGTFHAQPLTQRRGPHSTFCPPQFSSSPATNIIQVHFIILVNSVQNPPLCESLWLG